MPLREGAWRPSRSGRPMWLKNPGLRLRIERGLCQVGDRARWKAEGPPHPHKELRFWGRSPLSQTEGPAQLDVPVTSSRVSTATRRAFDAWSSGGEAIWGPLKAPHLVPGRVPRGRKLGEGLAACRYPPPPNTPFLRCHRTYWAGGRGAHSHDGHRSPRNGGWVVSILRPLLSFHTGGNCVFSGGRLLPTRCWLLGG